MLGWDTSYYILDTDLMGYKSSWSAFLDTALLDIMLHELNEIKQFGDLPDADKDTQTSKIKAENL